MSQRRGIISLIPKKNKDKTILENLRPLSLLNVNYKILTKVLADRLEKVLPKILSPDQTGYAKGRYTGENIYNINHEIKTTMYADDTTVFLSDKESASQLLELPNYFNVISGLEVNSTKTEAMWLGKWENRCDTTFNFK